MDVQSSFGIVPKPPTNYTWFFWTGKKAFDKEDRIKLIESLERMSVHPKIIKVIKSIYKDTRFKIEIEGTRSKLENRKQG